MSNDLSLIQFQRCVPKAVSKNITQELVDKVNTLKEDESFREAYRENILGYANVMKQGKFKISSYLDAVRFCSYKLMGDPTIKAYAKTFPDRYESLVVAGTEPKNIQSYATLYSKNKLVNLIMEQSMIPFHVFNQDARQKALQTQVELMTTARSEKVRSDAANSVLTHTKGPETAKLEIDVNVKQDSSIDELRIATQKLVAQQELAISTGSSTAKDIAHSQIIEGEVISE